MISIKPQFSITKKIDAAAGTLLIKIRGPRDANATKWEQLQGNGYHPELAAVIARYQRAINEKSPSGWIPFLQGLLDEPIEVGNKTFLEIGHGGGWYLAQSIRAGASRVTGIEVSEIANQKSRSALEQFGYSNFELFTATDGNLTPIESHTIDVGLSLTVFQHVPPALFSECLTALSRVLSDSGVLTCRHWKMTNGRASGVRLTMSCP